MIKVTFITWNLLGGGAERALVNLTQLINKKYNVDIISLQNEFTENNLNKLNIDVVFCNFKKSKLYYLFYYIFSIRKYLLEADWLVGSLELMPTYIAVFAAKIYKKKSVAWVHTDFQGNKYFSKRHVWLMNLIAYKLADKIVFVSHGAMESFLNIYPKQRKKCSVIYNSINILQNSKFQISEYIRNKKYILSIGRLDFNKGHDNVIKAFHKIIGRADNLGLIIAGTGPFENELKELVTRLGIEKYVQFVGFIEDPSGLILNSKAVVLGSRLEGMPTILIEAMLLQVPVLSFDCKSGPRELLQFRIPLALIENQDIDKLADAMNDVLSNPSRYILRGNHELNEFTSSRIESEWQLIFKE